MRKSTLKEHLEKEHKMSPLTTYLKEIVFGGSDGIVTTFAVVAGFAGAQTAMNNYPVLIVLLFGLANLFADGVSMGLSNFLSLRSEQDLYNLERNREKQEIRVHRDFERVETIEILQNKGFSKKQAEQIASLYETNEEYWADFMMNHELELPNPSGESPHYTGLATFFAFITFGFIPLIPYIFFRNLPHLFFASCLFVLAALFILGVLRFKATKQTLVRSVGETLILGSLSASVAYLVGTFFRI